MTSTSGTIEYLKLKLSSALKNKLQKETEALSLRNKENLYTEELTLLKSEIKFTSEQLQNLKSELHLARHQISLVNLCSTTEKYKAETLVTDLNNHKMKIDEMYNRVNIIPERELELIEEKEQIAKIEKEREIAENEELVKEAAAVEKECDAIERECIVLKKRNNAIMLKLRRKLVETENHRKELINKNNVK